MESDADEAVKLGEDAMKRLILTTSDSGAGSIRGTGLAYFVGAFGMRFVWGELSSEIKLDTWLSPRSVRPEASGSHWLDNISAWVKEAQAGEGLIEYCEHFDTIALWVDPDPNSQLTLIWLLDYLRRHSKTSLHLSMVQAGVKIGDHKPEELTGLSSVKIEGEHLEVASKAWQAWRQPTPQVWFNLLSEDISILPQLRLTVLELLEELPMKDTGLGATEMRMLELISARAAGPFAVFPGHKKPNKRRVFGYWEVGELLDGLARCPEPAVSGLDEGPFTLEMHEDKARHARYKQSKLKLTPLGEAVLAGTEDFSRHNPLHRGWGATELTSDRLWRWDPATRNLIAP
jgi:hypothetical protein